MSLESFVGEAQIALVQQKALRIEKETTARVSVIGSPRSLAQSLQMGAAMPQASETGCAASPDRWYKSCR